MFATCSADLSAAIWDTSSMTEISRGIEHIDFVYTVKFIGDTQLLSGGKDKLLNLWDIRNFKSPVKSLASAESGPVRSIDINPNSTLAITTSHDSQIEVFDLQEQCSLYRHFVNFDESSLPTARWLFAKPKIIYTGKFFHNKADTLLTAHQDSTIKKFSITPTHTQELGTFHAHKGYVRNVAIAPNDSFFVSGCQDGTIRLWDALTNYPVHLYKGHNSPVSCLAITRD